MILYAETSAVLRWLLGQSDGEAVRRELGRAERVVASHLTVVECERAFVRLTAEVDPGAHAAARAMLQEVATRWTLIEIDARIRARAGQPFPVEPVRTLDALHLATLLELVPIVGPIRLLSCDDRVIANGKALGVQLAL